MNIAGIGRYNSISNTSISLNNFNIPELPDSMPTKGQASLSDSQIKDKIMEMERRDVARGINHATDSTRNTSEWLKLKQEYVSSVSPDRKGIINSMLAGYAKKFSMMMPNYNRKLNFLELLMQNSRLFGSKDVGNNFLNFRDASGNIIAMWQNDTGWTEVLTDAELSREHEFMQMTADARDRAAQEFGNTKTIIGNAVAGVQIDLGIGIAHDSPMDMTKLAAHGITYDATTGKTNVDLEKLKQMVNKPIMNWKL